MRPLVTVALALAAVLVLVACSGGGNPSGARIRPVWVTAEQGADTVSIGQADVEKSINTHFRINQSSRMLVYMAYKTGNQLQMRASVCPPCGSQSFSLQGDTLVCDACGTVFNAKTGEGISGPCVSYPKAAVPFDVRGGKLVARTADLLTAYQNTLSPGLP